MGRDGYYWCVRHERVESGDDVCPARYQIGPFATAAEAAHALQRVQQRNEAWDAEDARWEGEDR
jgi:glycerol-3-phosphate dehydrogenase